MVAEECGRSSLSSDAEYSKDCSTLDSGGPREEEADRVGRNMAATLVVVIVVRDVSYEESLEENCVVSAAHE